MIVILMLRLLLFQAMARVLRAEFSVIVLRFLSLSFTQTPLFVSLRSSVAALTSSTAQFRRLVRRSWHKRMQTFSPLSMQLLTLRIQVRISLTVVCLSALLLSLSSKLIAGTLSPASSS